MLTGEIRTKVKKWCNTFLLYGSTTYLRQVYLCAFLLIITFFIIAYNSIHNEIDKQEVIVEISTLLPQEILLFQSCRTLVADIVDEVKKTPISSDFVQLLQEQLSSDYIQYQNVAHQVDSLINEKVSESPFLAETVEIKKRFLDKFNRHITTTISANQFDLQSDSDDILFSNLKLENLGHLYSKSMGNIIDALNESVNTVRKIHQVSFCILIATFTLTFLLIFTPLVERLKKEYDQSLSDRDFYRKENLKDMLTGIGNRNYIELIIDKNIAKRKTPFVCAFIDMDQLKYVNDNYGHEMGDWLICNLAQLLDTQSREKDYAARLGGDEFVLVFTTDSLSVVKKILLRVQSSFTKRVKDKLAIDNISFSYGFSTYPEDGDKTKTLLNIADHNMYINKQNKKRET